MNFAVIFRTSILVGIHAVILYLLIRGEVVADSMWWPLFILGALSGFLYQFGRHADGTASKLVMNTSGLALIVFVVLAFVFIEWKGGIAVLLSGVGAGLIGHLAVSVLKR